MKPAVCGPRIATPAAPTTVTCWNCGRSVTVTPTVETCDCAYCGNRWNWQKPRLIRGQR